MAAGLWWGLFYWYLVDYLCTVCHANANIEACGFVGPWLALVVGLDSEDTLRHATISPTNHCVSTRHRWSVYVAKEKRHTPYRNTKDATCILSQETSALSTSSENSGRNNTLKWWVPIKYFLKTGSQEETFWPRKRDSWEDCYYGHMSTHVHTWQNI